MVHIGNSWDDVLKGEFDKDYYLKLREFLKQEYGSRTIYPNMYDIFNALKFTPYQYGFDGSQGGGRLAPRPGLGGLHGSGDPAS